MKRLRSVVELKLKVINLLLGYGKTTSSKVQNVKLAQLGLSFNRLCLSIGMKKSMFHLQSQNRSTPMKCWCLSRNCQSTPNRHLKASSLLIASNPGSIKQYIIKLITSFNYHYYQYLL